MSKFIRVLDANNRPRIIQKKMIHSIIEIGEYRALYFIDHIEGSHIKLNDSLLDLARKLDAN